MLKIGMAQIAPVWLDKTATTEKICQKLRQAAEQGCELVVFGEALLPGYPFWLALTNGTQWNSTIQKEIHAHYIRNAVQIENGDLDRIRELAAENRMAVYLGTIERAADRGGHSLYCSLVYIDQQGVIQSVHRKLVPTYDERLAWSNGDGHGLRVHRLKEFTVGGLNCWENWMPLARTSLYAQGENLHVAVWPGSLRNTQEITRFIALESRSFVVSVSSLMRSTDFPDSTPHLDQILAKAPQWLTDGGSCLAGPDGEWVVAPVTETEDLIVASIDFDRVLEERQNFDPSGHYSRPDVVSLTVNRDRQSTVTFENE